MQPVIKRKVEYTITFQTLLKILSLFLFVIVWLKIWPLVILFLLGLILAVTFTPVVRKLCQMRVPESLAVGLVAVFMITFIALIIFVVIPPIVDQVQTLAVGFPHIRSDFLNSVPDTSPFKKILTRVMQAPDTLQMQDWLQRGVIAAGFAVKGALDLLIVIIFAMYLLIDGKRTFTWMLDFFGLETREKLEQTASETSHVIYSYVGGQAIMSLCGIFYVFVCLSILKVPAALTLAVLSGIMDVLPVAGFFLSVIPAILLGLTVSPTTAVIVFAAYVLYHAIENYILVPWVYGSRLQVSKLAIFASLLLAGSVGGILAIIPVLPVIASYPIIERIWLSRFLGAQVVARHSVDHKP
jgi:predicted PurR-regulated permease PerM